MSVHDSRVTRVRPSTSMGYIKISSVFKQVQEGRNAAGETGRSPVNSGPSPVLQDPEEAQGSQALASHLFQCKVPAGPPALLRSANVMNMQQKKHIQGSKRQERSTISDDDLSRIHDSFRVEQLLNLLHPFNTCRALCIMQCMSFVTANAVLS